MNACHPRFVRLLRTTAVIVFASILLTAGQTVAAVQPTHQVMAVRYFDHVLENVDQETASAIVSPDARLRTPEGSFDGPDGPVRFATALRESFSDLEFVVHATELAGDQVVVRFTMTGIHTGPYAGLEPDCAGIAVPGMAVLQAGDAGIADQWISYDRQTVLDQIHVFGVFNPDGRPACGSDAPAIERFDPPGAPACTSRYLCETRY